MEITKVVVFAKNARTILKELTATNAILNTTDHPINTGMKLMFANVN